MYLVIPKKISVKLFEEAILNKSIILSELILCEFAFTSKKLKEDENIYLNIQKIIIKIRAKE